MGAHRKVARARRITSFGIVGLLASAVLVWAAQPSFAVHDNGMFELDGNIAHDSATTPPYDWASLFGASGNQLITPDPDNGPLLASGFQDDTASPDPTIFSGGVKIGDPINTWSCSTTPEPSGKTNITYSYAALVQVPAGAADNGGHTVLYLGVQKEAAGVNGDNAFGFWLFKNSNVGCTGAANFSGAHTDGDIFITGLFTNGGGSADVEVFRWNGDDNTGSISAAPILSGAVCGAAGDSACAIANAADLNPGGSPWNGPNATIASNTFVEAGIDITTLLGAGGGCFTNFLADSQTSQSPQSQPKDFTGGHFNTCPQPPVDTTATPGGTVAPGTAQHDEAAISKVGNRADPTGTLTFFLCQPSEVTAGGCESGGTQVGTPVTISGGSATSANVSGATDSTLGKYCWRAEYAPDAASSGVYLPTSETNAKSECFTVAKNTTALTTSATASATIGASIGDTAHLTGATAGAGGTITFNLYGPSAAPDCSGAVVFTDTVPVSGNGDYPSGTFTPSTAGSYYWTASYSGDGSNAGSSDDCGAADETSSVGKLTTLVGTAASSGTVGAPISDTATLSGATANAGGTITFNLYGPSDLPDCTGASIFTSTVNVTGNGNYLSGPFAPSTAGTYYWTASYSGDVNNLPSDEACGAVGETSTLGKVTTLIGTAASSGTVGAPISDTATLSGATATAGGTITFQAYGPSDSPDCSGAVIFTSTVNVNGNGNYASGPFTPSTAGAYYWIASYSGDVNNLATSGNCGDLGETSTLGKHTTLVGTAASSGTVGDPISDTATLSGATATAGGTITFNLHGPSDVPDCTGASIFTSIVTVTGNGNYASGPFTPTTAGPYYWTASYSGDPNNLGADEACGAQGETSVLVKRSTGISTAATDATVGSAVHDEATLSGATANAGGTITFDLYGPSAIADCTGAPAFSHTVNVSGPGAYSSGNFGPATAGSYYWIASYSGDVNNLPSSGSCGDAGETSTIGQQATSVVTAATSGTIGDPVSDTATLSGATANAGGTITFNLYGPSAAPDCTGVAIFTSTVTVTGNADYVSGAFTPATAGSYYWTASYSGDVNNLPSAEACGANNETSTLARHPTDIVTAASSATIGDQISDIATLSGATAGAGGTITFQVYGPSDAPDCSAAALFTSVVTVTGPGEYTSDGFTPATAGSYYWIASYSGDVNNLPSSGRCGADGETSAIGRHTSLVATAASSGTVGASISDTATLSGATAGATGTITFNLYGPSDSPDCSGRAIFTSTVTVTGNGDYPSGPFAPAAAGSYYWTASYSGDVNNLPSDEACGALGETSMLGKQPTLVGTAASSGTVGAAIHDTATLSGATAGAGGTITFNLFGPSASPDCTGTAIFTATVTVAGNGDYLSGEFTPASAGSYYWTASYSGDVNNLPSNEACGAPGETSTLGKQTTLVGTAATSGTVGETISDVATLSGATADAGGTITFSLFGPSDSPDCTTTAIFTATVDVTGPGDYRSGTFKPTAAGSYYWTASYSGDVNNLPSDEACGADHETSTLGALGLLPTSAAPPPTSPPSLGTASTGAGPVLPELAAVVLLVGSGLLLLLLGRTRRSRRAH